MPKRLIVVAGNIGAGKTSLTERLGSRLGWQTAFESVSDNPYLADFYADMRAWSFHLQVFFLGHRSQQYLDMANLPQSVILDRSIYEDAYIFARALHHLGNLSERDYLSYRRIFDLVVVQAPAARSADLSEGARPDLDRPHPAPGALDRERHHCRLPLTARVIL